MRSRALGAPAVLVLILVRVQGVLTAGCAARTPPPPVPAAPTPTAPPAVPQAAVSEAALLELEDRRAFDAATLGAAAASPSVAVRARGALALGRIGDERAAALLRRLFADPSPEVRRAAAFAAGILVEPELLGSLTALLADPDASVAAGAAWSLSAQEQPAAAQALIAAAHEAPPERLPALLRSLWRYPTPEAAAVEIAFVGKQGTAVDAAALYALARRPQESSLPVLTAALAGSDADTAALCARALGLLGKAESIGPLWAAAAGSSASVRIAAMLALEAILEKNTQVGLPDDAAPRLLSLSGDTNPNRAVPALALLRWLTVDREVFRRLWSVASSGRGRRQQVALAALMAGLSEKARDLVDASIASPDPFLRGAAAESLSFLPAADAAPRRARLASDPEALVRGKVLEGLRTEEDVRENRGLVDAALGDSDPAVQAGAIDALARLEDPAVLPLLREAVVRSYWQRAPDVAIEAIAAAEARPQDPAARGVVEAAYRHPSVLVSRLARRSLVRRFQADPAAFPWRTYDPRPAREYARAAESESRTLQATVETERGAFTIRLAPAAAPLTVANFLALARRGFFDGAPIHRVVPGFVVQDGDPTGTGDGGPGFEIRDELSPIPYEAGTVGMALAGPDTGGSQWFVTQAPQPHLDGGYTVFGRVVAGLDVVLRIEQGDRIRRVTASPSEIRE